MYIAVIPNRNSPPAILLRESYRENGKVKNRTLANLSCLPQNVIDDLKRSLKGKKLVSPDKAFEIVENGSPSHGHVEAVITAMKKLNLSQLISKRRSRERDIVLAMVAARILQPQSKLATTQWWLDTTLPEEFELTGADEDDLYSAMDWLLQRQSLIEKKLADRHLQENGLALYDLTSSYFEGVTCPLAAYGHNRDSKKGKLQVNYGLLTNKQGIPVAVSIFKGNTGDPKTFTPQIAKIREKFKLEKFILVGDRGMITQKQINLLHGIDGIDWITALRPTTIKKLVDNETVQMGLFDERNLFELKHPDFPKERLIACRNQDLGLRRAKKREKLIAATMKELEKVRRIVTKKRLHGKENIEKRINKVLKNYRVGKYFTVIIDDNSFDFEFDEDSLLSDIETKCNNNLALFEKRLQRADCHIEKIVGKLARIHRLTQLGVLHGKDKIGIRIGKVINKYKVGKHFSFSSLMMILLLKSMKKRFKKKPCLMVCIL